MVAEAWMKSISIGASNIRLGLMSMDASESEIVLQYGKGSVSLLQAVKGSIQALIFVVSC